MYFMEIRNSHSFSKLSFQISTINKGWDGKNNRTNAYNDCITEMVCGRSEEEESTGGCHSTVLEHCALLLRAFL